MFVACVYTMYVIPNTETNAALAYIHVHVLSQLESQLKFVSNMCTVHVHVHMQTLPGTNCLTCTSMLVLTGCNANGDQQSRDRARDSDY